MHITTYRNYSNYQKKKWLISERFIYTYINIHYKIYTYIYKIMNIYIYKFSVHTQKILEGKT